MRWPRTRRGRPPRPTTPPMAKPLPRPLANVIASGVTPCAPMPQKCSPVRPQPVCTSSEISRMPCSSRTSLYAANKEVLDEHGILLISDEVRSEEHTSELQSQSNLVCRLLLEK